MIFKLHYWFFTSGACATGILLGPFLKAYTDASPVEIGALFMIMPVVGLFLRPLICAYADRIQAHRTIILWSLFFTALGYLPFVIVPFLGESVYHDNHARACWYVLVSFKTIGDIAFGAVSSLADTMAINYARRIGTEFGIYRIWGTVSWILFGLIIGQINEIWFLPKYAPAFMILIISSLIDMSLFWLWPKEYFRMVTLDEIERIERERLEKETDNCTNGEQGNGDAEDKTIKRTKIGLMTKSLMPKEVVWSHVKCKLLCSSSELDNEPDPEMVAVIEGEPNETNDDAIGKMTQIKILLLLIRRDIRIGLYFFLYILAGLNIITGNFFFLSLEEICNTKHLCNYSSLGGLLQASMASAETILFIYIKDLEKIFGRVNLSGLALFFLTIKFGFYGTIWTHVSPYYSIGNEVFHGIVYSILFTFQVETAHEFANEVEYLLPEMMEKGMINERNNNVEKLKLSLSATMQSLMTCANDGIGRGLGALVYGIAIEKFSYISLWWTISLCAGTFSLITFAISIIENSFNLVFNLKKKHERKRARAPSTSKIDDNIEATNSK